MRRLTPVKLRMAITLAMALAISVVLLWPSQSGSTLYADPPNAPTITAVDGDGNAVESGGTTTSDSITFTFTATDNTGATPTFECSLDGAAFSVCTSPQAFTGLCNNGHTFIVRAIHGPDSTDSTFSWTIERTGKGKAKGCDDDDGKGKGKGKGKGD